MDKKPHKRKYFIGNKKLKNIKMYEDFDASSFDRNIETNEKFDITKSKTSIAGKLEEFIGRMGQLNLDQIKSEFTKIVKDPATHASDQVRTRWMSVISNASNKIALMHAITNLYLKAAQLGVE